MEKANKVKLLLEGQFVESQSNEWHPVENPANQEVIAEYPNATKAEVDRAVASAKNAFIKWREKPAPARARVMLAYQHLLKQEQKNIAKTLSRETGKTHDDAMGEIWRGIEVVEHAANICSLMMGETVENVASRVNSYSYVQPLGVCAGITPFNFPAMIPLWMFPMALATGNTFVLKPSEQDPLTPMLLAELLIEAGADADIMQVVHGGKDQVNQILEHPDISAISFVGSTPVGKHIYTQGCANGKRVQALCGAKNHLVVMPDANKKQVINNLVGASVGAAGQRCMAISVAVFVGESKEWIPDLVEEMAKIRPGLSDDPNAGYGPLINKAAKTRVLSLIASGKEQGAACLLDGSHFELEESPDGNWVGPTLFSEVSADMAIYQEEIFGPVLCCMQVNTLEEAIALINSNPNGNGTSIFTDSGSAAAKFEHEILVGNVGINIPIPVPLPFFHFSGWRGSFFGDLHAYGKQAVRFYTETKTVTSRWFNEQSSSAVNTTITLK